MPLSVPLSTSRRPRQHPTAASSPLAPSATGRRSLLLGALPAALAVVAAPAFTASARADEPTAFPAEFVTAREDRSGWDAAHPTDTQRENARLIIAVAKAHDVPAHGAQIALATAIVESWLYNRDTVTDGTSGGLFQQQTSWGWGSADQVRDKVLATCAFFGVADHTANPGLLDVPGWRDMSIGQAAQAVQASAYPDRYAEQAEAARSLWDGLAGGVGPYAG